jgi:tetratricopeptide (TPR) repeat protein
MPARHAAPFAAWGLTLLASIPLCAPRALGDVIYLKDGTKLEGEIVQKTDAGWVVKTVDGKTTKVPADKVKSLEAKRNGPGTGGEDPSQRLASLRRSVESQSDINKILDRYQKFIEQNIGTPAGDEAVKDMQGWQDRLDKHMVKVGDKWVTKDQQDALKAKGLERAAAARRLLIAGRTKEATAEIDGALSGDPQNVAALYLRGVALFRQGQVLNARKAFDAVLQLSPSHGPSLNNVAVIMWGAKQYPGSLNFYGQAMNASPGSRQVLDNVAEALNELPEAQRDNAVTKKVVLMFNAQDMSLQGRMKKRGLVRWGSTWVEEKELKDLKDQESRIEDRLDQLEDDFKQVQERVSQINRDISDTERSMHRIEANSYGRDPTGRVTKFAYPRTYYDLKHDIEQLQVEREKELSKAEQLRKKAKQVKQQISVPKYTGIQQIVGAEGTPELPPLSDEEAKAEADRSKPAAAAAPEKDPVFRPHAPAVK